MIERSVSIVNRLGLHARAAAKLVHTAGRYPCEITLVRDDENVDGKSILGILLLAAEQGSTLSIRCDGEQEEQAIDAICALIQNRFGEES